MAALLYLVVCEEPRRKLLRLGAKRRENVLIYFYDFGLECFTLKWVYNSFVGLFYLEVGCGLLWAVEWIKWTLHAPIPAH